MASALGNLMANYTDSEGEELAEGGSEGEGEGNPSLADRWDCLPNWLIDCSSLACQIKSVGGTNQCNGDTE